jgi:hypothetical protein
MVVLPRADHLHFVDNVEQAHEQLRTASLPPEASWISREMRPIAELCSGEEAHRQARNYTRHPQLLGGGAAGESGVQVGERDHSLDARVGFGQGQGGPAAGAVAYNGDAIGMGLDGPPDTPHSNWTLEKAPVRFRGRNCTVGPALEFQFRLAG